MTPRQIADALRKQHSCNEVAMESVDREFGSCSPRAQPWHVANLMLSYLHYAFAEIADADDAERKRIVELVANSPMKFTILPTDQSIADSMRANGEHVRNAMNALADGFTETVKTVESLKGGKSCRTQDGGLWLSPECAGILKSVLATTVGVDLCVKLRGEGVDWQGLP